MKYFLICVLSSLFLFSRSLMAQPDLTGLSGKERIALAEEEADNAKSDYAFQELMQSGHELFKGMHYLKAIHKYEEAQVKRPYNVYPKVIIADIELSMKDTLTTLRAAENASKMSEKNTEKKPEETREKPYPQPQESTEERLDKIDKWEASERQKLERDREVEKTKESQKTQAIQNGDVPVLTEEDFQKDLGIQYPSGITEEITKEGNKTITKRIVVDNGKGNEYKKVLHNWGGVFYFKNGEAVTERVWLSETEE